MALSERQVRIKWGPITGRVRWKALEKIRDEIESRKRWQVLNGAWTQKSGFIYTDEDRKMMRDWKRATEALTEMVPLKEGV